MIQVRLIDREKDYAMLCEWWFGHGWPALPIHALPRVGSIALDGEVPIAAAFLYMDNSSPVCSVEWIVSNPAATGFQVMRALTAVVEHLKETARSLDYTIMLGATKTRSIGAVLTKADFAVSDDGITHFVCILKKE